MAAAEDRAREVLTLDQFRAIEESDEYLYELDDGVLVREPRPARPHGTAVTLLARYLAGYALDHGGLVTAETGFVLGADPPRVFGPDLAYLRSDPAPYGDRGGWIERAPDLAVEVISPSNRAADMKRKVEKYLRAGTAEVWLVYPESRSVECHRPSGAIRSLREGDVISTPVLPGFELPVAEIFRFQAPIRRR
jgi:Uma2 family endonuclease